MSARKTALSLLCKWEEKGTYVNLTLSREEAGSQEEKALLTALLYGTVERCITLDYHLGVIAKRRMADLTPHTRNLLRLGAYQILYLSGIPDFAAVNECVKLAENRGEASLLNGVLRTLCREKADLSLPPREKNFARYLSVKESFPLPLVRLFLEEYGEARTESILSAFNREKGLTLRVNTLKISRADYLAALQKQGIKAEPTAHSPFGVRLTESLDPTGLYGFAEGYFFVQDEASQIAACALDPQAGQRVLDLCACPGGKSFSAALLMENKGQIDAFDLHESKLSLVTSGAERLGITALKAETADATLPRPERAGVYDRVICDVPCSGLGVLGKKPDLRHRDISAIKELPPLQARILENAADALAKDGVLVYSTCTLLGAENRKQVEAFLSLHPEFRACPFSVGGLSAPDGMLELTPDRDGTDGFFIAKLIRA